MRLRKQIVSFILSACVAVTTLPVNIPVLAVNAEAAETEETTGKSGADGLPETESDGIMPLAGETEAGFSITGVTIADTYYSLGGKFPMYVEYTTDKDLTNEQRGNLKLEVKKSDGTSFIGDSAVSGDSYENSFTIGECNNSIKSGDSYDLDFSIIYENPDTGAGSEIWSSDTKTVKFENKNHWAINPYISTKKNTSAIGFVTMDNTINKDSLDAVYLYDKDGNIAAGTVTKDMNYLNNYTCDSRYGNIFLEQPCYSNINIPEIHCTVYHTRELKNGEILYAGYSVNGEVIKLQDVTFTVTDKPLISSGNIYINNYYPGMEDSFIVDLSGTGIDFDKLSIILKNRNTGKKTGESVSFVKEDRYNADYCIKLQNGKLLNEISRYYIEFIYSGSAGELITDRKILHSYSDIGNIIWNAKAYSIEYYNKEIPALSTVSYEIKQYSEVVTSGVVSVNDSHLIKLDIGASLDEGNYDVSIRYTDSSGSVQNTESPYVYIYDYKKYTDKKDEIIYSGLLYNDSYFSSDESFKFSVQLYCSDEYISNLQNKCNAKIYKLDDNSGSYTEKDIGLSLDNKNNSLSYNGTYEGTLEAGRYRLRFTPDGSKTFSYYFYVYQDSRLYLIHQNNNIGEGIINIYFKDYKMAEWYCDGGSGSKLQNNLKIRVADIRNNEIGIYSCGDFTINRNTNYIYATIKFSDKIKQQFSSLYFCYVYLYYGNDISDNTVVCNATYNIDKSLYYEHDYYEGIYLRSVIRQENNGYIMFSVSDNIWQNEFYPYMQGGNISYSGNINYDEDCDGIKIIGSKSAFPAKITITDWYSFKPLKTFTIQSTGYVLTESDLSGLSETKLYRCYLEGADGCADNYCCYLKAGTGGLDTPTPVPTAKPSTKPGTIGGGGGGSAGGGGGGGSSTTTKPSAAQTPEASASPQATKTPEPTQTPGPTQTPEATRQPEPTREPEATNVPEATNAPQASTGPAEPDKNPDKNNNIDINNNPQNNNTDNKEDKGKLTLKKKKITLKKGQKAKIRITSKLNTKVTYKSLKPSVATVNKNGVVTAKKAGKATITVKANGKTVKVKVTVKKADSSKTETKEKTGSSSTVKLNKDFKLSKTKITLKKGKKLTIKKAAGLSGKITFKSLDKKIATVSVNGVVKAKKKGKVTILVKKGSKTIKLKITVKK